jgi:hypothetical protein
MSSRVSWRLRGNEVGMVRRLHTSFFRSHTWYILIWEVNGSFWATLEARKVENVCLGKRLGGQEIILERKLSQSLQELWQATHSFAAIKPSACQCGPYYHVNSSKGEVRSRVCKWGVHQFRF